MVLDNVGISPIMLSLNCYQYHDNCINNRAGLFERLKSGSRVQFLLFESEFIAYALRTFRFVYAKTGGQNQCSAKLIQRLKNRKMKIYFNPGLG